MRFNAMKPLAAADDALLHELEQARKRVAELERQLGETPAPNAPARSPQVDLARLLENTIDAIWALDRQQRLVFFNGVFRVRFEAAFGVVPRLGLGPRDLLPPRLQRVWHDLNSRALAGESFQVEQSYVLCGVPRVFDVSLQPTTEESRVTGLAAISRDVTEYKRAQEELLTKSSILQSMVQNISDGVVVADETGHFVLFNPAAERIIGIGATPGGVDEWTKTYGLFEADGVTPVPAHRLPLARAIGGEAVDEGLLFVRNERQPDGVWLSVNARPLLDESGERRGGVAVFRDVTHLKKGAEAQAAEQQFMEQLIMAHERDRQLMAYEIHDGLVQEITGALMHLEAFWPQQRAQGRENKSFDLALQLLRDSLDEGRRLISGLRPPILDEMGIVAAIDYLIGEHVAAGTAAIRFNHDVHFDRLEPLLEGTLFRIAQEALNNIKKHSQALTASVDLSQLGDRLQLQVRDTGVGFDVKAVDKRRFGLRGIRERARLLRGRATVESTPGRGTRIFVELPIAEPLNLTNKRSSE